MHVIVHAEHDDVVLAHEIDLELVARIAAHDRYVVAVVPIRVLVRNDHVAACFDGAPDNVVRAEHGGRDSFDDGVRTAELEGVAVRRIPPRECRDWP